MTRAVGKRGYWVFILGYAVYCTVYMCRFNLTTASILLQSDGVLDAIQYGLLGSAFAFAYSIGRVVNGYLGDFVRSRIMVTMGIGLAGLANILLGTLPGFGYMFVLWAVNGYAQSMIWGALLHVVTECGPGGRSGLLGSILTSSVSVGSILGILMTRWTTNHFALGFVFYFPGILAVSLGVLCMFCMQKGGKPGRIIPMRIALHTFVRTKSMLITAFLHGFIKDSVVAWAPFILFHSDGIVEGSVMDLVLLMPIAGLVGRFLFPVLFHWRKRDNGISKFAFSACFISGLLLCVTEAPIMKTTCLFTISVAISMINTSMLSVYPMRFRKEGLVSSVSGWMDFATYIGSAVGSVLYGILLSGDTPWLQGIYICWAIVSAMAVGMDQFQMDREERLSAETVKMDARSFSLIRLFTKSNLL